MRVASHLSLSLDLLQDGSQLAMAQLLLVRLRLRELRTWVRRGHVAFADLLPGKVEACAEVPCHTELQSGESTKSVRNCSSMQRGRGSCNDTTYHDRTHKEHQDEQRNQQVYGVPENLVSFFVSGFFFLRFHVLDSALRVLELLRREDRFDEFFNLSKILVDCIHNQIREGRGT